MGKYSERLTNRLTRKGKPSGYCIICGEYKNELSKDHVPPQGAAISQINGQKTAHEFFLMKPDEVRPTLVRNGGFFKTVCKECNNYLSNFDNELIRVNKLVDEKIRNHIKNKEESEDVISIPFDSGKYSRAMVGHLLASLPQSACDKKTDNKYILAMRRFVLGETNSIENVRFYYWFFPFSYQLMLHFFTYRTNHLKTVGSIISFYPVAFMLVEDLGFNDYKKGLQVGVPNGCCEMDTKSETFTLNLRMFLNEAKSFPFSKLQPDDMFLFNEDLSYIGYAK